MRINKYLASAGFGSRRKVEELIIAGKVKVNGKVVTDLATDVRESAVVTVSGEHARPVHKFVYYKLHKPKGYVTTAKDEHDRKTVMELMRGVHMRVFPVGRLDYDTEGLLLFTNDGDLTNILTQPKSDVDKSYVAHIDGEVSDEDIKKLTTGINLGDVETRPCSIQLISRTTRETRVKITISEGKNRQVRRMFETIGREVMFLRRTQIGEIRLGGLSRGEYAELNAKEMKYLNNIKSKYSNK